MKLPDEFSSGSKVLAGERELLALGLAGLAVGIADKTIEREDFRDNLQLNNIEEREKNRIILELSMFNLFIVSKWMAGNYKDDYKEILDRMFFHFRKVVSDNDLEFGTIVEQRHLAYEAALRNQKGAGPAWWFGKTAAQFVLDKEDFEKQIGVEKAMKSIWMFCDQELRFADFVKEFVESARYKS